MNVPLVKDSNPSGKPKILIVDDSESNIIAMEAVLADLDLEILTTTLPDRALYQALINDLALIIMDVQMPVMDGVEVATQIRSSERSRHVPIMFVTGVKRDRDEMARGYDIGAVDYLFKPVDNDILRAKVGAFMDIHKHRLELQKDHELLKVKNKKLREFAHIASHDLKAPLRQMSAFGQELVSQFEADGNDGAKQLVAYICSAANRLQSLISSLLMFATVENVPLASVPVNLEDVVCNILTDFQSDLQERKATINISELPTIEGSAMQIQEVLHNLISNALKYQRPDVPLNIDITGEVVEKSVGDTEEVLEYCKLKIADNGTGIRKESHAKIFEPFQRLVSFDKVEGSGLGLAIVNRIVERHHGTISVDSTVGEGTTFTLILPTHQNSQINSQNGLI